MLPEITQSFENLVLSANVNIMGDGHINIYMMCHGINNISKTAAQRCGIGLTVCILFNIHSFKLNHLLCDEVCRKLLFVFTPLLHFHLCIQHKTADEVSNHRRLLYLYNIYVCIEATPKPIYIHIHIM